MYIYLSEEWTDGSCSSHYFLYLSLCLGYQKSRKVYGPDNFLSVCLSVVTLFCCAYVLNLKLIVVYSLRDHGQM